LDKDDTVGLSFVQSSDIKNSEHLHKKIGITADLYKSIHSSLEIHTSLIILEIKPTHISCLPCFGMGIISDHLVI